MDKVPLEIRRKVLIRGVNWVGDAIMVTPALRQLRHWFAGSHITLLVRPWVAAVYENNPDIDELWIEDDSASIGAFLSVARRIRHERFDFGIALTNSFRSAALLAMGQVKHRIGFARGWRSFMLTRAVELDDDILNVHQVYYYLRLIEWLRDEKVEAPKLVLEPNDRRRAEADAILSERGIRPRRMLIGIAPGSINSTAKRWLPERFAQLADRFQRETGAEVLLLGSEKESAVLAEVGNLCESTVHNLSGSVDLAQLIAVMERLDLFIGNDSGAMHIAAALRVPCVSIFGPTEFNTTYPFSISAKIVRSNVDCSPCMLRTCPIDHRCMTRVSVDEVVEMVAELAGAINERMSMHGRSRRDKVAGEAASSG